MFPHQPSGRARRKGRRQETRSRLTRRWAMLGALIMAIGALLPWVRAEGTPGQVSLFWDNNLLLVFGALLVAALTRWLGAVAALPVALLATGGIVLVMHTLPGTVVGNGYWQAELTWGAGIALFGAVIALGASLSGFSARLVAP